jgi:hypothetical protein
MPFGSLSRVQLLNSSGGMFFRTRGGCWRIPFGIHQVAKLLAGLEIGNAFGWNLNLGARLGIATNPWLALPDSKAAEPAYLDLVACLEGVDDGIEDGIDDYFPIAPRQVSKLGHFLHQVCFGHGKFCSERLNGCYLIR